MIRFTHQEIKDLITCIDVITGVYNDDLAEPVMGLYRHDGAGFHRLRSVQHGLYALMTDEAQAE